MVCSWYPTDWVSGINLSGRSELMEIQEVTPVKRRFVLTVDEGELRTIRYCLYATYVVATDGSRVRKIIEQIDASLT